MVENQNIQETKRALYHWNYWGADLPTGIPRDRYTNLVLRKFHESNQVIVITGPRKSGKSYVMRQVIKRLISLGLEPKNTLYINFEDLRLAKLTSAQLLEIINNYKQESVGAGDFVVLLDEIAEIAGWEKTVRTLYETSTARIILSGSNSKLLSGELASSLTGRHVDITVYPLSFNEYKNFKNISSKAQQSDVLLLNSFLENGGFPLATLSQDPKEVLVTYWNDLLEKDLIRRYAIRKTSKFKDLATFYLTNASNLITFGKMGKNLEIKSDTVEKYSSCMENAFLMFFPKVFSYKHKEVLRNPRKVYCIDTGLQHFAGFSFSQNLGWKMENFMFLELLKSQKYQLKDMHYWKNEQHKEVDFVVQGEGGLQVIQACWDTQNTRTLDREQRSLLLCLKDLGVKEGLIITSQTKAETEIDGFKIRTVPVLDWVKGL